MKAEETHNPSPKELLQVVILGGGFAGLATAFHLSAQSKHRVTLIEREPEFGVHASGRNAGLVMQNLDSPLWSDLVIASRRAFEESPESTSFRRTGSWQLGSRRRLEALIRPKVASRLWDSETCRNQISILAGSDFEAALETPSDGVIDPHRLLEHYSSACSRQGVRFHLGVDPKAVSTPGAPNPFRIAVGRELLPADVIVNATGAWANSVAEQVGAAPQPLTAFKRHLFHYLASDSVNPNSPFVWDQERDFYVRPMAGNEWMYCLCDEIPVKRPEATVDEPIRQLSLKRRALELPALSRNEETRCWSCFRTKATDGNPIIGWDPDIDGLFWVAGLGGGGMSASWGIGRLATERLMSIPLPKGSEDPLAPRNRA